MPKLSIAQKNDADALALKLFEIELVAQKHLEILQENPAALVEAHNQYAQIAPSRGPARSELQNAMQQVERELQVECTSFLDRVRAVCNAVFFVQTQSQLLAIENNAAYMLMMKKRSDLHTAHYSHHGRAHAVPPPLSPLLAQQLGISTTLEPMPPVNDTPEYPLSLPARQFTFLEIANAGRVKITPAAFERCGKDPGRLRNLAFVGMSDVFTVFGTCWRGC
ncbi:hypothetical protein B0H12DRAFT_1087691 [Mycena haematopus]|nr:hypothetical protein B0H12DRAFT_1087691 [Mycena haematopus]